MIVLLLVLLVILMISVAPIWNYSSEWGYLPSGSVLVVVVLTMIFLL